MVALVVGECGGCAAQCCTVVGVHVGAVVEVAAQDGDGGRGRDVGDKGVELGGGGRYEAGVSFAEGVCVLAGDGVEDDLDVGDVGDGPRRLGGQLGGPHGDDAGTVAGVEVFEAGAGCFGAFGEAFGCVVVARFDASGADAVLEVGQQVGELGRFVGWRVPLRFCGWWFPAGEHLGDGTGLSDGVAGLRLVPAFGDVDGPQVTGPLVGGQVGDEGHLLVDGGHRLVAVGAPRVGGVGVDRGLHRVGDFLDGVGLDAPVGVVLVGAGLDVDDDEPPVGESCDAVELPG